MIVVLFRGFKRDLGRILDAKGSYALPDRQKRCTEQAGVVVGRSGRLAESDGEQYETMRTT